MNHWSNKFIGIPYLDRGRDAAKGCDCWGLARLVYNQQLGIILPSYTEQYSSAEESAEVSVLLEAGSARPIWSEVKKPAPFDLLLFRHGWHLSHVGIAVDARQMLHIQGDDQAKIESFIGNKWASRLLGVYRYINVPARRAL